VVGSVEFPVESTDPAQARDVPPMTVQMFGPLTLRRNGVALTLPASRKVRGLFAYLALSPRPVSRSQLCELLWEIPNDPRGELRWCLSKIRNLR
jgi:DNA-binding SARP family transcriptional activator